jgi:hypothetical protein
LATTIAATALKTEWIFAAVLVATDLALDKGLGLGNDLAPDNDLRVDGPAQGNVLRVGGQKQRSARLADDRTLGNDPVAGAAATLWEILGPAEAPAWHPRAAAPAWGAVVVAAVCELAAAVAAEVAAGCGAVAADVEVEVAAAVVVAVVAVDPTSRSSTISFCSAVSTMVLVSTGSAITVATEPMSV